MKDEKLEFSCIKSLKVFQESVDFNFDLITFGWEFLKKLDIRGNESEREGEYKRKAKGESVKRG